MLFRLCDQYQGPPQRLQFRGARGLQLTHGQWGQQPHRQNRTLPRVVRTTTRALHSGQSRRQRIFGRGSLGTPSNRASLAASARAWRSTGSRVCQRQTVATCTPATAAAARSVRPARRAHSNSLMIAQLAFTLVPSLHPRRVHIPRSA
jgi:hypothetical protein